MILSQYIGDKVTHRIPMRWQQDVFTPAAAYSLIWTLKASLSDTDSLAKVQKYDGAGITESVSTAILELLPIDTGGDLASDPVVVALDPGTYYWDIQAQAIADVTDIRTVAAGTLKLLGSATKNPEVTIPVYVENPSLLYDGRIVTYY